MSIFFNSFLTIDPISHRFLTISKTYHEILIFLLKIQTGFTQDKNYIDIKQGRHIHV